MYAGRFGRGAVDSVSGRADTGSTASLLRLGGVDLTPRQTELADAALRLLAREGMPAVTFRAVAAESGWSLGAVQKAYASKSALLAAMFARLREAAQPRVTTEPGRPTLHEWLVGLFLSIMPLDERRRDLQLQGSAFTQRAAYDPAVAAAMSLSDNEIRGLLGGLVRRAQGEGEVSRELDPDDVAWQFLALAEGVSAQPIYEPQPTAVVRARVATAVDRLLRR